jgi:hypothetical protein
MSHGSASTSDIQKPNSEWALLMTHLPCFCLDHSEYKSKCHAEWELIKSWAMGHRQAATIVNSIETSIQREGNPRLIVFALEALIADLRFCSENVEKDSDLDFITWQKHFSSIINLSS